MTLPAKKKKVPSKSTTKSRDNPSSLATDVEAVVASLKRIGSKRVRDEMATRFGIRLPDPNMAFGVRMSDMQKIARAAKSKDVARNHALAGALWDTGWYEARMVASLVDVPALVTPAQMDRWCRDFDNWGIVDTVCFKLFDETPHAFAKVKKWAGAKEEFVKRAAFALLACLALHNKDADDDFFAECLPLIERAAADERNFVKKGVSWALRSVGRRSSALHASSVSLARKMAGSSDAVVRWVGKDVLRDITKPAVVRKLKG